MKLLVISHTPHYKNDSGEVVGWGPTIREINYLTQLFDEVRHVAPLYAESPPQSSLPYNDRVKFEALEPTGGPRLIDKIGIFWHAPKTISIIKRNLDAVDVFQFRAPTGIGVYLVPWLSLFSSKKGWFKYAGNWKESNAPWSYRWQRFLLTSIFKERKVTINGKWPGQPMHVLTFENPALTQSELEMGKKSGSEKNFSSKLTMLFVGRIEKAKGIDKVFELVAGCSPNDFQELIVVGDGDKVPFSSLIKSCSIPIQFTGGIPRDQINHYYTKAHIVLLPSISEGFPKVIAEGLAFGCIPAVSNVSAIGQYIDSRNGLIFSSLKPEQMTWEIAELVRDRVKLKEMSIESMRLAPRFTYAHYHSMILKEILEPSK